MAKSAEKQKGKNGLFSITNFAKFSRVTRDTLLYYDSIGLLSPSVRGENGYRYYTTRQLATVNLIRTLQLLGIPLAQIKEFAENRTPAHLCEVLDEQFTVIEEKIDEWKRSRKLLETLKDTIHPVLDVDADEGIAVEFMRAEAIVLGGLNDYSRGRDDYDALIDFYNECAKKYPDLDLNYPVWGFFSEERIKRREWVWPDRYYFNNPDGHDKKNAGLYAIGYAYGGYGQHKDIYVRMLDFIDDNGLEVCGPAYEEYPLNEISVVDENEYLMRVMITVREKGKE